MAVLAFDTSTADTVVGLQLPGEEPRTAAHRPAIGERPGHSAQLLVLANRLLADAGVGWSDLERIGVGTGPGTFTGLRIAVSTARALVQAGGQELVAVGSLEALALPVGALLGETAATKGEAAIRAVKSADIELFTARSASAGTDGLGEDRSAGAPPTPSVLACGDARRGELWVAAWRAGAPLLGRPRAVVPAALAELMRGHPGPWRAVGDGAVHYRTELEAAGAEVPPDSDPRHHLDGAALCALALLASPVDRDALEPEYVRAPDAVPTHLR